MKEKWKQTQCANCDKRLTEYPGIECSYGYVYMAGCLMGQLYTALDENKKLKKTINEGARVWVWEAIDCVGERHTGIEFMRHKAEDALHVFANGGSVYPVLVTKKSEDDAISEEKSSNKMVCPWCENSTSVDGDEIEYCKRAGCGWDSNK